MSRTSVNPRLRCLTVGAIGLVALSVVGCGKIGPLEQPAPLFGARAKAQYQADKQQAQAASQAQGSAPRDTTGSAERQVDAEPASNATGLENSLDNQVDDAPRTTRDIKDPDTQMTTPRDSPVPGEPNPGGPMPSLIPPNR